MQFVREELVLVSDALNESLQSVAQVTWHFGIYRVLDFTLGPLQINRPTIKRLALEHPHPIKQRNSCLNWDEGVNLPIRWHEVTWSQLLTSLISLVREPDIFASAKLYCQVALKCFVPNKVYIRSSTFYVKALYCLQYFIIWCKICYGKVQIKWVIFFPAYTC